MGGDKRTSVLRFGETAVLLCLSAFVAALLWSSRSWPIPPDAGVFYFAGAQAHLGAAPYRDFVDLNLPVTYWLYEGLLSAFGVNDVAFRVFDLLTSALIASLFVAVARPASGRAAWIGGAFLLLMHLTFGPSAPGQRDWLALAPALLASLLCLAALDRPRRAWLLLAAAGASIAIAVLIKPTAALLLLLPLAARGRLRWRDLVATGAGALALLAAVGVGLQASGSLQALLAVWTEYAPVYQQFEAKSLADLSKRLLAWAVRLAGFTLPALLLLRRSEDPPFRIGLCLVLFGAVHFIVQRKGYEYHLYPLLAGLILAGSVQMRRAGPLLRAVSLCLIAAFAAWRSYQSFAAPDRNTNAPLVEAVRREASAMQSALVAALPPGARVQLLDSDGGGYLAMAGAGMRQATPDVYWFLLLSGPDAWRARLVERLEADPPDAVLVTNTQWPLGLTFEGFDRWSALRAFVDAHYAIIADDRGVEQSVPLQWRLYLRKKEDRAS